MIDLNTKYTVPIGSTAQYITEDQTLVKNGSDPRIQQRLFLPPCSERKGEGGLRGKRYLRKTFPDRPLVSVITIVFNGEKYLEETIRSVINQTYDNVEYIIIDGGSTDRTVDIIKKYEDKLDYWVSEPDRGISDAFNKGISLSSGIIIGIVNADDWYELDAVAQVVSIMKINEIDIVHGQLQYWRDNTKAELVSGNHNNLHKDMTVNHMTVFVKRYLYERIGGFSLDFDYAMDYEFLLRAKKYGASFYFLNECIANMRFGGVSDIKWQKALREVAGAKEGQSSSFYPKIYYIYQIIKSYLRRCLDKLGLNFIVCFYHRRFSLMKKITNRE